MTPFKNVHDEYDLSNLDELSLETPVGWSSICLDQTIDYYIECNSISVDSDNLQNSTS